MPRTTFLYQTEAVGASGQITLPVVDTMPIQASIATNIGTGFGKVRVDGFKHLDYLWLLKGDLVTDDQLQDLMNSIRSVPGVQLVMELVQDKIRNKGHLIF